MEMKFYSVEEIAEMLGTTKDPIYQACKPDKQTGKAELANYRIGKGREKSRIVITNEDLMDYLRTHKIEATTHNKHSL